MDSFGAYVGLDVHKESISVPNKLRQPVYLLREFLPECGAIFQG